MFKFFLGLTIFISSSGQLHALDECTGLTPKGGEDLTESFKGSIAGEIDGIVAKLAGGSANINGEYTRLENDTLKDYPEANKIFVWQSIIYLACVRPESGLDLTSLFAMYLNGPPKENTNAIENSGDGNVNINESNNIVISN